MLAAAAPTTMAAPTPIAAPATVAVPTPAPAGAGESAWPFHRMCLAFSASESACHRCPNCLIQLLLRSPLGSPLLVDAFFLGDCTDGAPLPLRPLLLSPPPPLLLPPPLPPPPWPPHVLWTPPPLGLLLGGAMLAAHTGAVDGPDGPDGPAADGATFAWPAAEA